VTERVREKIGEDSVDRRMYVELNPRELASHTRYWFLHRDWKDKIEQEERERGTVIKRVREKIKEDSVDRRMLEELNSRELASHNRN